MESAVFSFISNLLASGLSLATPLLFAALGEIIMERAGILNISLEGKMLVAAFFAMVAAYATQSPLSGLIAGILAACVLGVFFALFTITLRADQIIVGAGLNILALGLTGVLYRELFGKTGATLSVPTFETVAIPGMEALPFIGRILFRHNVLVYAALAATLIVWGLLYRLRFGLYLRAVGENPGAADAAGLSVWRIRFTAVILGSILCGFGGSYLSIALANTFVEGMTAGRGFIALAIVIFARWQPFGAWGVAWFFGAVSALQFQFQAFGWQLPYQLFLMLPYILTLVAAAFFGRRARPPAALGQPYYRE